MTLLYRLLPQGDKWQVEHPSGLVVTFGSWIAAANYVRHQARQTAPSVITVVSEDGNQMSREIFEGRTD